MKILLDEITYEGTAVEILDELRMETFNATEFPSTEAYIRFVQSNVQRMTDHLCLLPEGNVEDRAKALLETLAEIGALERLAA